MSNKPDAEQALRFIQTSFAVAESHFLEENEEGIAEGLNIANDIVSQFISDFLQNKT